MRFRASIKGDLEALLKGEMIAAEGAVGGALDAL